MNEVALMEMLSAREARVQHQQELLNTYGKTLICFTMNIAGPVKQSPLIARGFAHGCKGLEQRLLAAALPVLYQDNRQARTGCEGYFVVDDTPLAVKAVTAAMEDETPMARLYDIDVLRPDGSKVDRQELGLSPRKCLICGEAAADCARSRRHSVPELQAKTTELLTTGLNDADAETIAQAACRALLYEVATTPKPGLVDRANSGSHRDMDFFTFLDSAAALYPYFARCARIGQAGGTPAETFTGLRQAGLTAEGRMLAATKGVNTHKGAIFSIGLLCGAAGRRGFDPENILSECAAMTAGLTERDFAGLTAETAKTAGQQLYLDYGITGVRGQAEAGFPAIGEVGLPVLEEGLRRGYSINDAGCGALLAILACTVDTNMIHRSDYETAQAASAQLKTLLAENPYPSQAALDALDTDYIRQNLSPGGSADLLAGCYFLHFLKEESHV